MIYLIILIVGAIMSFFGPWWIVAPIAFIACRWKATSSKQAFAQSFAALLSLWMTYIIYIFLKSEINFVNKIMGVLTSTPAGFSTAANLSIVLLATALLASIVGGIAGLAGYKLKKI